MTCKEVWSLKDRGFSNLTLAEKASIVGHTQSCEDCLKRLVHSVATKTASIPTDRLRTIMDIAGRKTVELMLDYSRDAEAREILKMDRKDES